MSASIAAGGPTDGQREDPADIDLLQWEEIAEMAQRRRHAGARTLASFIREGQMANCATGKNDATTTIIDQGERRTYAIGDDTIRSLFDHLEACRLEGSVCHWSERQGTLAAPSTGIMLDYDIYTAGAPPAMGERHFSGIAKALAATLQRDLDFGKVWPAPPGARAHTAKFKIFFIAKPAAVRVDSGPAGGKTTGATYKYGFHVLVPGVRVGRAYKKWLVQKFRTDEAVRRIFAMVGVDDAPACLDQNSASVPVLFFGSCKRGGTPYVLAAAYEAEIDVADGAESGFVLEAGVLPIGAAELAAHNLVAETSLRVEAAYPDGRPPLVAKHDYVCRPAAAIAANGWAERAAGGVVASDELVDSENSISALALHDPEARYLHTLLGLLPLEYAEDRNKWRNVIYALSNAGEAYKPLAVWFSQRAPLKWAAGGPAALDSLWAEAAARRGRPGEGVVTVRSLAFWARTADEAKYAAAMERAYFTTLTTYVYEFGGKLQHYMIAKVLHSMLHGKFVVDVGDGARGAAYVWYEFVVPGQPMRPGEVWKWRRELVQPGELQVYISERLSRVLVQISDHLEEKRAAAGDNKDQAKYYHNMIKAFGASRSNLYHDGFKHGVIAQAAPLFHRRGFRDQLDNLPNLFGVANGVLSIGPKCELVDRFHEYPVSRYSNVVYKRFDSSDPMVALVLGFIARVFPEPDARDWVLFHAAQGLSRSTKEGLLLLLEGGGQNGKTAFVRAVAHALGPYATKFNIQLLSSERESADRPNSALMALRDVNYAYCEETSKAQVLNDARMKEVVNSGELSGRDLNTKQETFTMKANLVVASQFSFLVLTKDHGTWRRIWHYTAKSKFRAEPDPNNPFEHPDDPRFANGLPEDPAYQAAWLSVLAHYYERLQNEYGGQLKRVRSPTIEAETDAFRIQQDTLHRWIRERVVCSTPEHATTYPVSVLAELYLEWYAKNIDRTTRHTISAVIKDIESSILGKSLRPGLRGTLALPDCRIAGDSDCVLFPGETFLVEAGARDPSWSRLLAESSIGSRRLDGREWWEPRDPVCDASAAFVAESSPGADAAADRAHLADLADLVGVGADDSALIRGALAGGDSPASDELLTCDDLLAGYELVAGCNSAGGDLPVGDELTASKAPPASKAPRSRAFRRDNIDAADFE